MSLNPISQSIVDRYAKNKLSFMDKLPEGIVFYPGMPEKEELLNVINSQIEKNIKAKINDTNTSEETKQELDEKLRVFTEADKPAEEKAMELTEAKLSAKRLAEIFLKIESLLKEEKIGEIKNIFNNDKDEINNSFDRLIKVIPDDEEIDGEIDEEKSSREEKPEKGNETEKLLIEANSLKDSLEQTDKLQHTQKTQAENLSEDINKSINMLDQAVNNRKNAETKIEEETKKLKNVINQTKLFISSVNEESEEDDDSDTKDSSDDILKSTFADNEKEIKNKKEVVTNLVKEIGTHKEEEENLNNELSGLQIKQYKTKSEKNKMKKISKRINTLQTQIESKTTLMNQLGQEVTEKLNELKEKKEILKDKLKEEKGKKEELDKAMGDTVDVNEGVEIREKRENVEDSIKKTETYIQKLDEILALFGLTNEDDSREKEYSAGFFSNFTTLKPFQKQISV